MVCLSLSLSLFYETKQPDGLESSMLDVLEFDDNDDEISHGIACLSGIVSHSFSSSLSINMSANILCPRMACSCCWRLRCCARFRLFPLLYMRNINIREIMWLQVLSFDKKHFNHLLFLTLLVCFRWCNVEKTCRDCARFDAVPDCWWENFCSTSSRLCWRWVERPFSETSRSSWNLCKTPFLANKILNKKFVNSNKKTELNWIQVWDGVREAEIENVGEQIDEIDSVA